MHLTDAATILREVKDEFDQCLSDNYGACLKPKWEEALDLAIAILEEQPEVAPARKTDPETSHRAAPTEFKAGSAREKILLAAYRRGQFGDRMTARELVDFAGLGHQRSPWKRVSELAKAGYLQGCGEGTDPFSRREVTTYSITQKGRAAARERLAP